MPKKNKEIEIVSPEKVDRDLSNPITFRTDSEAYSKIATLKNARDESISEVIKRSVDQSFEVLILRKVNSKIFYGIKKIFGKPKGVSVQFLTGHGRVLPEEEKEVPNPFEDEKTTESSSNVIYKLGGNNYTSKNNKMDFLLNFYQVELTYKASDNIEVKFIKPSIIIGNFKDFDHEIYMKILEIVGKHEFKTEMETENKESTLDICFKEEFPIVAINNWFKEFEKKLKIIKEINLNIENYLKKNSKVKQKLKKKPVND